MTISLHKTPPMQQHMSSERYNKESAKVADEHKYRAKPGWRVIQSWEV